MSNSFSQPNPTYEFVCPTVTHVDVAELRVPDPLEVIVAHGVHEHDFRAGQVGSLTFGNGLVAFTKENGPWHCDPIKDQAHLTVQGRCIVRLATLVSDTLPAVTHTSFLIPQLLQNMVEVEAVEGDLVLFHGTFTKNPDYHQVETISSPRRSLLKTVIG